MASNYHDVHRQLADAGLIADRLDVGRMRRCKVEGEREKRGWYILHELTLDSGEQVLVGSYGIWRGNDNGAHKIELSQTEFSKEQAAALRKRLADDRKRAAADRKAEAARAAKRAEAVWLKCSASGEHDYLTRKGIGPHGVKFSPQGALVIPMLDPVGRIHGLQFILSRKAHAKRIERTGRDKEFWPAGLAKRGHFHLIGMPGPVCLACEGYATGATLHQATGLPVVVAFDAGNLTPALEALAKRYKSTRWLVCADDDAFSDGNPGVSAASTAAMAVSGAMLVPKFADEAARQAAHAANGRKLTDFNDLAALEGLHSVRSQVEDKLRALAWETTRETPREKVTGGEGSRALRPIEGFDELIERFALIYGHNGTVFDFQERRLLALSDMRDACVSRELHRRWQECPQRLIYRVEEVGFDPAETDATIKCNLWAGWPTTAKPGSCERLLELLRYMCAGETRDPEGLFRWVLRWIAYPIQNPGAKLKTCLVIHGPQGTGKNLFFESIMAIYGRYGRVLDQSAVEDKFNDWASRKLFIIADEVVARSDLYHVKNKLKGLITGDWIRINPKNVAAYDERNHCNLVFLSNEVMPSVLEEDDRRHTVIWTPAKLSSEFYAEVADEIRNGGIEALHDHLLTLDLGDFATHSKPFHTQAKEDLIELSCDTITRFFNQWVAGDIDGIPIVPALSEDVFALYRAWCSRQGIGKGAQLNTVVQTLSKKPGMVKDRKRYMVGQTVKNPACFLTPPKAKPMPEGESATAWLGERFTEFKCAVSEYRGNYAD